MPPAELREEDGGVDSNNRGGITMIDRRASREISNSVTSTKTQRINRAREIADKLFEVGIKAGETQKSIVESLEGAGVLSRLDVTKEEVLLAGTADIPEKLSI